MTPAALDITAKCASGHYLSFDPGLIHPAAAAWSCGELVGASRVKVPGRLASLNRGERVRQIVGLVRQWWHSVMGAALPSIVVGEWPKTLTRGKGSKNSADQLYPLAAMTEGVAIAFGCELEAVIPFDWIGNVPKDDEAPAEMAWESPRGKLVKRCLRDHEIPRVVLSHDSVDAVGLGLWGLGRLNGHGGVGPRRYPGAV